VSITLLLLIQYGLVTLVSIPGKRALSTKALTFTLLLVNDNCCIFLVTTFFLRHGNVPDFTFRFNFINKTFIPNFQALCVRIYLILVPEIVCSKVIPRICNSGCKCYKPGPCPTLIAACPIKSINYV
jgi:hypothetical protein